jgi:ferritin-like metal-binding protein YciE
VGSISGWGWTSIAVGESINGASASGNKYVPKVSAWSKQRSATWSAAAYVLESYQIGCYKLSTGGPV